jgi:hypothetical protein
MATKADLEAREAECDSLQDYTELAAEALQDPQDPAYAIHLLGQAEMQCQFPADYIRVAESAIAAGDKDMAERLYEQAEEFCMEGGEFAEVASSLATHTDRKDKARELLQRAVDSTKKPEEILAYAAHARRALADDKLAASLLSGLKEQLKSVDDFKALAAKLLEEQTDADSARMLYEQAADVGEGPAGKIEFASGLVELFGDKTAAADLLSGVEGECMFPGQFVALAEGFKRLLDDKEKTAALLEQGKEFAMSGDENLDLANGYARLLSDQETALALYHRALGDFSTKDDLIRLADAMADNLADKSQAAQAYEKAEAKITDPNDLPALARAVMQALGDKKLAAGIFARAEDRIGQPNDLLRLGNEIRETLSDEAQAGAVYRKALDAASEYPQLQRLLDVLAGGFDDPELAQAAIAKSLEVCDDSAALLDAAERSGKLGADGLMTVKALDLAEDAVKSLDEMRKLNETVSRLAGDDTQRLKRVAAKLEKREASQAKYVAFQEREKKIARYNEFIALADAVKEELDDPFYAAQLLEKAEETLASQGFNLQQHQALTRAVDRLTGDADWVKRLLDTSAEKVGFFAQVRALGQMAARELSDRPFGVQWARDLYQRWEQKLVGADKVSPHELSKLARAAVADLGDQEWALSLLDKAADNASAPRDLAWLGHYARTWGEAGRADAYLRSAAAKCAGAEQFTQMTRQLKGFNESEELLRELYGLGEGSLNDPLAKLRWAEGIVREFGDLEWAKRVFDSLEGEFDRPDRRPIYDYSRRTWLKERTG